MQAILRAEPLRQEWLAPTVADEDTTPGTFLEAVEGRFAKVEALIAAPSKLFTKVRLSALRGDGGVDPTPAIPAAALEYQHLYEGLLHWSLDIRREDLGHLDGNQLRDQMAAFIRPGVRALENFPWELRDQVAEIAGAGNGKLTLKLNLAIEDPEKLLASIRRLHKQVTGFER